MPQAIAAAPAAIEPPPAAIAPMVVPPPRSVAPRVLTLDRRSSPPGARVEVTGGGCDPGAPVALDIGGGRVSAAVADAAGSFSLAADVPSLLVGRYAVTATCGPVLTTTLDVVLVSQVDPGTTTLAVLVFFVLLALAIIRRQRTGRI